MTLKTYTAPGFAAFVQAGKAHIIGAVKAGERYAVAATATVVFNETLAGLRADLQAKGYTILN
jgi:hypothetical protein